MQVGCISSRPSVVSSRPIGAAMARGVMVGLTRYINKHHICRAALESTAYQTRDVLEAMKQDSGVTLKTLKVDGGMTANNLLMQFRLILWMCPWYVLPSQRRTALGASYAAGLAVGFWKDINAIAPELGIDRTFTPDMSADQRKTLYAGWHKAVNEPWIGRNKWPILMSLSSAQALWDHSQPVN